MDKRTETGLLLAFYGALLTQRQRTMMRSHYDEDLSLAEIAEISGVSRQAVRDAIVRGEEQLREYEEKLGLMARDMQSAAELRALMKLTAEPAVIEGLKRLLERTEGTDGV